MKMIIEMITEYSSELLLLLCLQNCCNKFQLH